MTTRSFTTDSALQRHQIVKYMTVLGVKWVVDESLPRDQVGFTVTSATDEQWEDVRSFVDKVKG